MAMFEGDLGLACNGVLLEPPRFYLLHGVDDDVFRHGAAFATLADLLQPCRVCALHFTEECSRCSSLAELVTAYSKRILDDLHNNPLASSAQEGTGVERLVLVGYGLEAVVAHRMATELWGAQREVALILVDSEVVWPPAESLERMGGYPWQGGYAEAALVIARACGAGDVATKKVQEFLRDGHTGDRGEDEAAMSIFWELPRHVDLSQPYFKRCAEDAGYVLEHLHRLVSQAAPAPGAFLGDALLLSSESEEWHGACQVNQELCRQLLVVDVPGMHYNLLQRREDGIPTAVPQAISEFLLLRGFFGPAAQAAVQAAAEHKATADGRPGKLRGHDLLEFVD